MSEEPTPGPATNPMRRTSPPYRVEPVRQGAYHLLQTVSVIVTVTMLLGGLAVGAVLWVSNAQSKPEAVKQHEAMRLEFQAADIIIDRKVETVSKQMEPIGRDIKAIKCQLDPRKKAKEKTGCWMDP